MDLGEKKSQLHSGGSPCSFQRDWDLNSWEQAHLESIRQGMDVSYAFRNSQPEDPKRVLRCLQVCEPNGETHMHTYPPPLPFGDRVSCNLGWPGLAEDEDSLEFLVLLPLPTEK